MTTVEPATQRRRGGARCLTSLLLVETAAAAGLLAAAIAALVDWHVMPCARRGSVPKNERDVTAIVPARNEAANVGAWVRDVLQQTIKPASVIVADDCSDDGTSAVARDAADGDPTVEIVNFGLPPPGWVGKNWAAYNAALRANTQWLLFGDADVRMSAHTLAAALALAEELGIDALSLVATLACDSWRERQIMPVVAAIIFSGMPVCLVNDDRVATGLLAGGFMLVRREAYMRSGGHRAVRASIAEDRDLGERLKSFGYRIRLAAGADLLRVRMYAGGREMWAGWRKNFYEGARRKPWLAATFIAGCLAMLVLPVPLLAGLAALRVRGPLAPTQRRLSNICAVCVAATAVIRVVRDRSIGARATVISILTTPIGGGFAAAVMAASAWRIETGQGQIWKGRVIR